MCTPCCSDALSFSCTFVALFSFSGRGNHYEITNALNTHSSCTDLQPHKCWHCFKRFSPLISFKPTLSQHHQIIVYVTKQNIPGILIWRRSCTPLWSSNSWSSIWYKALEPLPLSFPSRFACVCMFQDLSRCSAQSLKKTQNPVGKCVEKKDWLIFKCTHTNTDHFPAHSAPYRHLCTIYGYMYSYG